ncbi:hypothetical protein [Lacipirellula parvula]|uniref:Glycoside hydrolase family 65 C-terminal domain-containing protein n=1 Tax=Lacipirellula parvula TaxID=2650471 RepID=A0A5K7X9M0_9BACT|nr:hypothetical protein [Lacipirellula parvula]BBO33075.1 hypothetical protein PLANPX_2687 [Lacipirellula parvula]
MSGYYFSTARSSRLLAAILCAFGATLSLVAEGQAEPPADFPRFVVPGDQPEMDTVRRLFWLHYAPAGPLIPLWDEWMPKSTLWPAVGQGTPTTSVAGTTDALNEMRRRWRAALSARTLNAEGYLLTEQHDGPAHAEGWPFPFWMHAGGIGWHFAPIGVGAGYEAPTTTAEGWRVEHGTGAALTPQGWPVMLEQPKATITAPPFSIAAARSPWLRISWWAAGLNGAAPYVEWTTETAPEWSTDRRIAFAAADGAFRSEGGVDASSRETRTMVALYRHPEWKGTITGLRIGFGNQGPAAVLFKSIHTAVDTRHNVNNLNFIRGAHDYFMWTRDVEFLKSQIERIRAAMKFVEREFQTRERKCIYTTWPGHEGRSGVRVADGAKTVVPGEGVGSNYWDLLPFGGEDALATVYYYDALHDLAALEEAIAQHPEWQIPSDAQPAAYDPADLRRHAEEVKAYGSERFWNAATGRFGTRDLEGVLHDYGFTFLNNEAIYHGFATAEQAKSINAWISGQRIVDGDTSTGPDIYRWRFGPRSTTRRNLDYYSWVWSNPEDIPWGSQVQDGGAVLGFSYHDLMVRLRTDGPDATAARLAEIAKWFEEVEAEGGYRPYYAKDSTRGTQQGGNVAGGLGLDHEFFESILVPQVMLYGFLGFEPTVDGCNVRPQLPQAWPELTVTRVYLHDQIVDVTGRADGTYEIKPSAPLPAAP